MHLNFEVELKMDSPEGKLAGNTVGHGSCDGQQFQQHRLKAQPLSALCSNQL